MGDWFLYDPHHPSESNVLERGSVFERRAPGSDRSLQWIAANLDTVFIVLSFNKDFNIAPLERYVALAFVPEVRPVMLFTKADPL